MDLFIRLSELYGVSLDYLILGQNQKHVQFKEELSLIIDRLKILAQMV